MARTCEAARNNPSPRKAIGAYHEPPPSNKRSEWTAYGCTICGWPSIGGIIVREACDLVEVKYLGFDPLNLPTTRLEDQAEEDEFCMRLKKIGGKWWRSERRWKTIDAWYVKEKANQEERRGVYIGWPKEGGVLVLEGHACLLSDETGMLRMVTEMEERCQILRERLGAVFYEDPDTYTGFHGLGPMEHEKDSEDEEDEAHEKERYYTKEDVEGQNQGRQTRDGKCVCS
jgi:hypothetical protein